MLLRNYRSQNQTSSRAHFRSSLPNCSSLLHCFNVYSVQQPFCENTTALKSWHTYSCAPFDCPNTHIVPVSQPIIRRRSSCRQNLMIFLSTVFALDFTLQLTTAGSHTVGSLPEHQLLYAVLMTSCGTVLIAFLWATYPHLSVLPPTPSAPDLSPPVEPMPENRMRIRLSGLGPHEIHRRSLLLQQVGKEAADMVPLAFAFSAGFAWNSYLENHWHLRGSLLYAMLMTVAAAVLTMLDILSFQAVVPKLLRTG